MSVKVSISQEFMDILAMGQSNGLFNTIRLGQNGHHFAEDIFNMFKCILLNENLWILDKISLKYVP